MFIYLLRQECSHHLVGHIVEAALVLPPLLLRVGGQQPVVGLQHPEPLQERLLDSATALRHTYIMSITSAASPDVPTNFADYPSCRQRCAPVDRKVGNVPNTRVRRDGISACSARAKRSSAAKTHLCFQTLDLLL